jgi:hypothetical protein
MFVMQIRKEKRAKFSAAPRRHANTEHLSFSEVNTRSLEPELLPAGCRYHIQKIQNQRVKLLSITIFSKGAFLAKSAVDTCVILIFLVSQKL